MIGSLWYGGVSIDPGRLIDDEDPAYYLIVVASYRRFLALREQEAAEIDAASKAP